MPQFGKQDVSLFNLNITLIILITWDHPRIPTPWMADPQEYPKGVPEVYIGPLLELVRKDLQCKSERLLDFLEVWSDLRLLMKL